MTVTWEEKVMKKEGPKKEKVVVKLSFEIFETYDMDDFEQHLIEGDVDPKEYFKDKDKMAELKLFALGQQSLPDTIWDRVRGLYNEIGNGHYNDPAYPTKVRVTVANKKEMEGLTPVQ